MLYVCVLIMITNPVYYDDDDDDVYTAARLAT